MKHLLFFLSLLLLPGCCLWRWSLPAGDPPPGVITQPESVGAPMTESGAFHYWVTALASRLTPGETVRPIGPRASELLRELEPLLGCRESGTAPTEILSEKHPDSWTLSLRRNGTAVYWKTIPLKK